MTETIPEVHDVAAVDEVGSALVAIDAQEMTESATMNESMENIRLLVKILRPERRSIPIIVRRNNEMVAPPGHEMMAPSCHNVQQH